MRSAALHLLRPTVYLFCSMFEGDNDTAAQYEERYCAFVDILGFSNIIADAKLSAQELRSILQLIHDPPKSDRQSFAWCGYRAQSISDAVCVSTYATALGLWHLCESIERLAMRLLSDGFFVRGAIAKGSLYHDEKMVFGRALIDAYTLEQKVARYPRIVLADATLNDLLAYREKAPSFTYFSVDETIKRDSDGVVYLHILNEIPAFLADAGYYNRHLHVRQYNRIAALIQRRLSEAAIKPRNFEKVYWFANYWNRTVPETARDVLRVTGPSSE